MKLTLCTILNWLFIFLVAGLVWFAVHSYFNHPAVKKYIKQEIRAAKMLNIITKYNLKPQGLET